jgi:hypothetical protein
MPASLHGDARCSATPGPPKPVSEILTGSATGIAHTIVSAGYMADLVRWRWFRAPAMAAAWLAWRSAGRPSSTAHRPPAPHRRCQLADSNAYCHTDVFPLRTAP